MKKSFFPGVSGVLVLFLIPYLMVILMNGLDTALLNRTFNVEMLLPVIVASEMGSEYELEAVKAFFCSYADPRGNRVQRR